MSKFNLTNTRIKVTSVGNNTENHGPDEHRIGITIGVEADLPSSILDKLSVQQDVQWPFWTSNDEIAMTAISDISFHREFEHHNLTFTDEEGAEMELSDVKLMHFKATPKPGRRVLLKFKMYMHPEKYQCGELLALNKEFTNLTLEGTEVLGESDQMDIADTAAA